MASLYAQERPRGGDRGEQQEAGRGEQQNDRDQRQRPQNPNDDLEDVEVNLQTIIVERELVSPNGEDLNLPDINDPKVQLGKQLFFAKNLGGEQSVACVSCHHPMLGGGDDLSLPVGVAAVNEFEQSSHDLLGLGRFSGFETSNLPTVPRNSPTIFNLGFNTQGFFWDSRVETRRGGGIVTPDSPVDDQGRRLRDPNLPEDATLAAAQARFPVTSPEEMRGEFFADMDNQELREALTNRFNNSDDDFTNDWSILFDDAFGDDEVSFDRISEAIAEYERSMVFIDSPWKNYLDGNNEALTQQQKAGAILFFGDRQEGGAGCAGCHRGSTLSSDRHHLVAYPQMGPGKGNDSGSITSNDFGRENVSNDEEDRYHFRAPTLLNIAETAPYGHTGAYQTLEEVVSHYNNPEEAINTLFSAQQGIALSDDSAPFCQLPQVQELMLKNNQSCKSLFPDAYENSMAAVKHLQQARDDLVEARSPLRRMRNLSSVQISQLVSFMEALTDPCVVDRDCLAPWIVEESDRANYPDANPLIAHDKDGVAL
jgi:cytochrome c peroxidase